LPTQAIDAMSLTLMAVVNLVTPIGYPPGKTTVSVLHDAQLTLNKQQQIWGGVYIHRHFREL